MKPSRICSALIVVALAAGIAELSAQTKAPAKKSAATPTKTAPAPPFNPALLEPAKLAEKAPDTFDVRVTTSKGDFVIRVTRAWAPFGADRFFNLVKHGYYDGCSLFRVAPGFVVQFGISGYPPVAAAWARATIQDDPVTQSNKRGFVTYAKSPAPNSRTTQIFINLGDNSRLDATGFSPFGEVIEGMEVVEMLYSGYAEATTSRQGEIAQGGKEWLEKNFPNLDSIKKAAIVPPAPAKKSP